MRHTELEIEQGEPLQLSLEVPGGKALPIEALAWHSRRVRDRSGNRFRALGLMISKAPEAYFELAPGAKPRVRPASPPEAAPAGAGGDLLPFRIRVKARGAPRTRTLCLSAASEREARALAVADLVGDWDALEVESS